MVDESAEAIVARLKAEGQLTRNSGTNSLKSLKNVQEQTNEKVSAVFEKMTDLFESINSSLLFQSSMIESLYNIQSDAYVMEKERVADEKRARLLSDEPTPEPRSESTPEPTPEGPPKPEDPKKGNPLSSLFGFFGFGGISSFALKGLGASAAVFVISALVDGVAEGLLSLRKKEGEEGGFKKMILEKLSELDVDAADAAILGFGTVGALGVINQVIDILDKAQILITAFKAMVKYIKFAGPIGAAIAAIGGALYVIDNYLKPGRDKNDKESEAEIQGMFVDYDENASSLSEDEKVSRLGNIKREMKIRKEKGFPTANLEEMYNERVLKIDAGKIDRGQQISVLGDQFGALWRKGENEEAIESILYIDERVALNIISKLPEKDLKDALDLYYKAQKNAIDNSPMTNEADSTKDVNPNILQQSLDLMKDYVPEDKKFIEFGYTIKSGPRTVKQLYEKWGEQLRLSAEKLSAVSDGISTNFNVAKGGDSVNLTPVNNTTNNSYTTIVTSQSTALGNAVPIAFSA